METRVSCTAAASAIVCFASVISGREDDALEEIHDVLKPPKPAKTLVGHVLFTLPSALAADPDAFAAALFRLCVVEYVHVLLASSALDMPVPGPDQHSAETTGDASAATRFAECRGLHSIHLASAAVPRALFDHALLLWRASCRAFGDPDAKAAADLPSHELVYRALGKRGGHGHGFSSDEAKRVAGRGLGAAVGISGSTSAYHLDVLAQVHCNRFWLGLRLNRQTLAKPLEHKPRAKDEAAKGGDAPPLLLSKWLPSRLKVLGLKQVRDARDAVAPLWEMPIDEQRAHKQAEMQHVVGRLVGTDSLGHDEDNAHKICAAIRHAPVGCEFRNKCEFHIGRDRSGELCCGFRLGSGSSQDGEAVASPDKVPILPAWMPEVARAVSAFLGQSSASQQCGHAPWTTLTLRVSESAGKAIALLIAQAEGAPRSEADALAGRMVAAAARASMRMTAVLQRCGAKGETELVWAESPHEDGSVIEELRVGLKMRVSPLSFFQVTRGGAEVLYDAIVEAMQSGKPGSGSGKFPSLLLDVCCGGGAIGMWAARVAADAGSAMRVVGIESSPSAVADATANAKANGLEEYEVICARAEDGIKQVLRSVGDVAQHVAAVVDPPRTGMSPSVCRALRAATGIDTVVFVSCNPHGHTLRHDFVLKGGSLAANAKVLCAAKRGGPAPFRLQSCVPVDMFPYTPHCELVLRFERAL